MDEIGDSFFGCVVLLSKMNSSEISRNLLRKT